MNWPRFLLGRLTPTFILIILCFQLAPCHKQPLHQYVAREGYSLLLKTYGKDVPQLSAFIGLADQSFAGDSAWQKGYVTTGAWREDDEDVVYHYDILPGMNYALTSITHFWSADRGDFVENMIRLQIERPPLPPISTDIGPFPNAFAKMMKFADGGWVLNYPRTFLCRNTANAHWLIITPVLSVGGFGVPVSYSGLTAFYKNMKLAVRSEQPNVCTVLDLSSLSTISLSDVTEIEVGDDVRNTIVWEVLGRMCHLLGDMSVPAHAHLDEHGLNPDSYEDWVGGAADPYKTWNADNAGPAIIYNRPDKEALHFLMYLLQQQADHFGSNGPADGNGNDNVGGDATSRERNFLSGVNLSSLGGPTTDAGPWSVGNLEIIRDKTIPFAIRATAGLLYWFCSTTGLMSLIPDGVPDAVVTMPAALRLDQNYPNPFNPTTVIKYAIAGSRDRAPGVNEVRLVVYDILGREVAVLVNERKAPGGYQVVFDGTQLSSGAYICRLTAGGHLESRKMLLMR